MSVGSEAVGVSGVVGVGVSAMLGGSATVTFIVVFGELGHWLVVVMWCRRTRSRQENWRISWRFHVPHRSDGGTWRKERLRESKSPEYAHVQSREMAHSLTDETSDIFMFMYVANILRGLQGNVSI